MVCVCDFIDHMASALLMAASFTLQHTATHGNTLQHTATHCQTLPHTAKHCTRRCVLHSLCVGIKNERRSNTLQHTATHCNTLQHTARHCHTLQNNALAAASDVATRASVSVPRHSSDMSNRHRMTHGVATMSTLLKIIGPFCKRAL